MLGNKKIMGNNILYFLEQGHIDRKDFAKIIGVPYSTLTNWINGTTYPRIDKIQRMADYFGVEKADLVEERSRKDKLSNEELDFIYLLREMNAEGRADLMKHAHLMLMSPLYQKT